MISTLDIVALLGAGALAGLVGTAGGIASMVSYPALLAIGLPVLPATFANSTALVACWPGSALASQRELSGRVAWLRSWSLVVGAGAGCGAALLLLTPGSVFERIVPFLVAAGSLALLCEPRLTAWRQRRERGGRPFGLAVGLLVISVYGGYFGAGSGIMFLTLMLLQVEAHLPIANALKNMLLGAVSITTAAIFGLTGSVDWAATVPLAIGALIGSNVGPRVTRRLPTELLRLLIVLLGIALAIQLWIDPHGW